jgi:hypothetical protein
MPCLDDRGFVFNNQSANLVQLPGAESMIPCERDGRQPELGVLTVTANMDVPRIIAVETVEVEPVWPRNPDNAWQRRFVPVPMMSRTSESAKSG